MRKKVRWHSVNIYILNLTHMQPHNSSTCCLALPSPPTYVYRHTRTAIIEILAGDKTLLVEFNFKYSSTKILDIELYRILKGHLESIISQNQMKNYTWIRIKSFVITNGLRDFWNIPFALVMKSIKSRFSKNFTLLSINKQPLSVIWPKAKTRW